EIQRLVAAAKQGKLATRGDPSRFAGAYAECVGGVNAMLDAVVGPLRVAADYVDRISKGDVPERITDRYEGDFNAIKNNLNACIDAIKLLIVDVDELSDAAVVGKLTARADVQRHQGDFGRIVQGVNATLDRLVGFIDAMPLPAMIVNRDFQVVYMNRKGLEVGGATLDQVRGHSCSGSFKTTDCKTERCACGKAMLEARTASSSTVAKPRDGLTLDIDYIGVPVKSREGEVIGAFEVVVDQTAARTAQRLAKKVAEYQDQEVAKVQTALGRISQGDLEVALAAAPGDADTEAPRKAFDAIGAAVHGVVRSVRALATDARMLSQAAVSGQLATRAEASRHQGDYRKIVEGVNATLDAVMGPINAATGVLQALAQQDLRARVTGEYSGDHAQIKQAVNATATALHDALEQVAEAVNQLASASSQIAATSQSVSQGASEQAAALEQTSSNLEEMSGMTRQNADNTAQANLLAQGANRAADKGSRAMERMSGAMVKIRQGAEGTAEIIRDINEIAFQTNLLALNAAVEAARAGDAGRGFAVVADEVRSLAQRAKEAARKTEDLIKESVKLASEGEGQSKEVAGDLKEIVEMVGKVTGIVSEIAAASQEQAKGIVQINKAITQMDQVTQQAAGNAEESSSASEELSGQAQTLAALVSRFKLERQGQTSLTAAGSRGIGPKRLAAEVLRAPGHGANGPGAAHLQSEEEPIPTKGGSGFKA
ncbi:MAG: PAS domain-containing protein, partial [Deltaproteobacteria bacterium]|nr:PAS domain-containing protein [Deltaproteobacteria bacterium]